MGQDPAQRRLRPVAHETVMIPAGTAGTIIAVKEAIGFYDVIFADVGVLSVPASAFAFGYEIERWQQARGDAYPPWQPMD